MKALVDWALIAGVMLVPTWAANAAGNGLVWPVVFAAFIFVMRLTNGWLDDKTKRRKR